jgi:thiol-disulfide isomerase/thioredoxin
LYQYYYYRNHYFDGVNFKDERILYTPFLLTGLSGFLISDCSASGHGDKRNGQSLKQCVSGSLLFNTLVGHFTYKYETNKAMSFDIYGNCNTFEKVFVHLSDNYITNGMAKGIYDDETIAKISERVNVLRNLLPGAKVADLHMIDTTNGKQVLAMGFDTARTSAGVTYLYNKNFEKLQPMFRSLSQVRAKYTVLVFWAVDCGHCQTEIPKLHEDLKKIRNSVDVKVYAVQTKEELYKDWKKFIGEKKLLHFTHVFDPIHLNNLKENF